jgi:hypothetical protein
MLSATINSLVLIFFIWKKILDCGCKNNFDAIKINGIIIRHAELVSASPDYALETSSR